jgi:hypothetical protein
LRDVGQGDFGSGQAARHDNATGKRGQRDFHGVFQENGHLILSAGSVDRRR